MTKKADELVLSEVNWKGVEERLGVECVEYRAGSFPEFDYRRLQKLDTCDFVLAHEDDQSAAWWADLVYAAGRQTPIVLALGESETGIYEQLPFINKACHRVIYAPGERWYSRAVARALWSHDRGVQTDIQYPHTERCLQILGQLESPIEARLAVHLMSLIDSETSCDLEPQKRVLDRYRIDLAVTNDRLAGMASEDPNGVAGLLYEGPIRICVECDGHDFHERTKEQAARDKSRDRELTMAGWQVLRFTGSEIWKDAATCARQVVDLVVAKGGKLK